MLGMVNVIADYAETESKSKTLLIESLHFELIEI